MRDILGDRKAIIVLLGPALIVYTLIHVIPIVWSFGLTFFTGNVLRGYEGAGLDNFVRLWNDPLFWHSTVFTLKYVVVATVLQVCVRYLLAILYVFVLRKGSSLLRTVVFFPAILPTVAIAVLFGRLFGIHPSVGPVNGLIEMFGGQSFDWFASGGSAFIVIILMDVWRSMGFFAILLFAGLVDIPEEIIESARIDGVGGVRLIRHIVVPLSLPVLLSAVVFSLNSTLKVFDSILALTNGGPGSETTPLTLYMYRTTFTYNQYGYGATIALALTAIAFLVTIVIFRSARKDITAERSR